MVSGVNELYENAQLLNTQIGITDDYFLVVNRWKPDQLTIYDDELKIEYRTYGDSFVIGYTGKAVIGTSLIGENNIGSWTEHQDNTTEQKITKAGRTEVIEWLYDDSGVAPTHLHYGTGTSEFNENQTALGTASSEARLAFNLASGPRGSITIAAATSGFPLGLIHYWKLNESSGNASDEVSGGWTLTNTDVSYIAGKFNNAADFDDNENLMYSTSYNQPLIMTVECWVKVNTDQTNGIIVFYDGANYIGIGTDTTGDLKFKAVRGGGEGESIIRDTTITTGTWYHLAIVVDTTNNLLKMYLNGVSDASDVAYTSIPLTSVASFHIGEATLIYPNTDVVVDDVRIWDDERSAAEIVANKDAELSSDDVDGSVQYQIIAGLPAENTITEWGIFNASSTGNMYVRRKMTSINLALANQYRITWTLKIGDI